MVGRFVPNEEAELFVCIGEVLDYLGRIGAGELQEWGSLVGVAKHVGSCGWYGTALWWDFTRVSNYSFLYIGGVAILQKNKCVLRS